MYSSNKVYFYRYYPPDYDPREDHNPMAFENLALQMREEDDDVFHPPPQSQQHANQQEINITHLGDDQINTTSVVLVHRDSESEEDHHALEEIVIAPI